MNHKRNIDLIKELIERTEQLAFQDEIKLDAIRQDAEIRQ
ncbi:hypothetical protein JOC74_004019 [Bacillus capparidis]|uniref:Uncharacterized protein n=1 Tax=Bacillus capparidis TaxID=1840411 RepID=A0ABS4D1I6_9BACI|nr:hypothetical protein [Bacillus capparidis]